MSLTYQGGAAVGMDYGIYMDRTHDWLAGDGFYRARQLTGQPYEILNGDSFYPPTLLLLLVPFALGLPAVLWWLIPIAIIAAALIHIRPPMWTWPIMAFTLLLPRASLVLVLGNPSLWMIAAAFAGVAWAWPSALLLLKPTLAPFALIGIRHRSWWIALGVLVLLSVPFGAMWRDYLTALVNAQNARGLEYTLGEWPLMIAPHGGLGRAADEATSWTVTRRWSLGARRGRAGTSMTEPTVETRATGRVLDPGWFAVTAATIPGACTSSRPSGHI